MLRNPIHRFANQFFPENRGGGVTFNMPFIRIINGVIFVFLLTQIYGLFHCFWLFPDTSLAQKTQTLIAFIAFSGIYYFQRIKQYRRSKMLFVSIFFLGTTAFLVFYHIDAYTRILLLMGFITLFCVVIDNQKLRMAYVIFCVALGLSVAVLGIAKLYQPPVDFPTERILTIQIAILITVGMGIVFLLKKNTLYARYFVPAIESFITISMNTKKVRLLPKDILYIKADKNYVEIQMDDGKKWAEKTSLTAFTKRLPHYFVQVHKSYVVNCNKVVQYNGKSLSVGEIILPIGRKFHDAIQKCLSFAP